MGHSLNGRKSSEGHILSRRQRIKGFTLIELIVVATIIAVMVAVGTVTFVSAARKSRDTKRKSDLEQIRSALEMYRSDNGQYPDDLNSLLTDFMPVIPVDPKGNTYSYTPVTSGGYNYNYNVQTFLEGDNSGSTCTAAAPYNYCLKNP